MFMLTLLFSTLVIVLFGFCKSNNTKYAWNSVSHIALLAFELFVNLDFASSEQTF